MIREHHLRVSKTARYFTLGDPGAPHTEVWFVCHGYGQLAGYFIRRFQDLAGGRRLIVAPEGLSRFYLEDPEGGHAQARVGATWMTREDRLHDIADYVAYLDTVYREVLGAAAAERVRVTALGFSQGVATVTRWVARGRVKVDRLVLWGDRLPPDLDVAASSDALRKTEVVFVSGTADPYWPPEAVANAAERLREGDIPYRLVTFDGGHELDAAVLVSLANPASR